MRNKYEGFCCWCGEYIGVGKGRLFKVEEGDEMLGLGPFGRTGWMVECLNKTECGDRIKKKKEERKRKEEARKKRDDLEKTLFPRVKDFHAGWLNGDEMHPYPNGYAYEISGEGWDIYGSGTRYVLDGDKIWKLINHGMDGDDWSMNNVQAIGAGAIGYVYPTTPERIEFLQKYCENISESNR